MNSLHSFRQPLAYIYPKNHDYLLKFDQDWSSEMKQESHAEQRHHNFQGFSYHSIWSKDNKKDINIEEKEQEIKGNTK